MNVDKIPYRELMAEAAERNLCHFSDLINLYPPKLSTYRITERDVDQAAEYMKHRGLDEHTKDLKGWVGVSTSGFGHLDITEPIVLDAKDKDDLGRARPSGPIDMGQIEAAAVVQARKMAAESDKKCLINDAFLGTAPRVIPRSVPDASQGKIVRDGIHVTPQRNRLVRSGILSDVTNLIPISWLESDEPFGRRQLDGQPSSPTDLNAYEVRTSPGRQMLQMPITLSQFVPGKYVGTALEAGMTCTEFHPVSVQTNHLQPQTSLLASSTIAMAAMRRSRVLRTTTDDSRCDHPSLGVTRAENTDLRRQVASMQALINSNGAVQDKDNGLFGTAAGPEVSAVVSGGLTAGYQSLSNRRETPATTVDQHDTTKDSTEPPAAQDSCNPREYRKELEELSSPVAAANTNSVQLQLSREIDKICRRHLWEEGKAPVGRPRAPRPASMEVAEDDSDYTPGSSAGTKRRQSVQAQKTPVKQRKLGTTPKTPVRSQFRTAPMTSSPREPIKPLNLISIDRQRASGQEGASLPSNAPPSPVVPISPCPRRSSKATGTGGEPNKGKKNAAPIFGLHRNQELARPADSTENAEYAWSAETADFAANSEVARYALRANRLAGDGLRIGPSGWPEDALTALTKLKDEFHAVEFQQRGSATRNAEEIKFAGCAGRALYAEFATEAEFALEVSGDGCEETDGHDDVAWS
ncbi:hypothetical protein J3458_005040 [Metarhizium acridum]|uniref:uncharacterized protein n=1 Tax=Metarhizium acridum TaxID=92637 RepID=UPI001C6D25A6|nr:hypothetical protein J3458_005040 [Metarhizium acridum]